MKGASPPAWNPSYLAVEPQAILEIREEGQSWGLTMTRYVVPPSPPPLPWGRRKALAEEKKALQNSGGQAGATPAGTSLLPDLLHVGNNMEAHATANTTQPTTGRGPASWKQVGAEYRLGKGL